MAKKKTVKKTKAKKAVVKRLAPPPQRGIMAVIPYSEIAKPEMHKGKYNLVMTRLTNNQIKAIIAPTPAHVIKKRPGKGGGEWDYIPGWWFKKKLNFVFGFDGWDTLIDGERIDGSFITVKGRLVISNTKDGKPMMTKTDFGGAEIKYKKGTQQFLDISNDFKAAQTDLIKRCCVQLGFAMDVYGKSESINAGQPVGPNPDAVIDAGPVVSSKVSAAAGSLECHNCANPITQAEADYSKKLYGKQLCRDCQRLAKQGLVAGVK